AVTDPLASQGSVAYDAASHVLIVTNAGSDSVSVFGVDGDTLTLRQVISSGGAFPTSIAIHNNLVYVLDTANAANVQGYRLTGGKLHPIDGSTRTLGITNTNPPQFLASPGQVGFSPDGRHVIVATKSAGTIEVFGVLPSGRLSSTPPTTAPTGGVPFLTNFVAAGTATNTNAGAVPF